MIARVFGLAMLGLAVAAFSVGTAGDKDAKKEVGKDVVKDKDVKQDKDKIEKKGKDKKDPPKVDLKSVAGEVAAIDFQKGAFSLAAADGKARTFTVNDDTKFVGPKGGSRGLGKPGLKDETMFKGAAVRVVFAQDEQVALEVHLPARGAVPSKTTPEPIKAPQIIPPLATQPQPELRYEVPAERVGPLRRVLRRIFRGE